MYLTFQTNGYHDLQLSLLLEMATGDNQDIRKIAWKRIEKCRNSKKTTTTKCESFTFQNWTVRHDVDYVSTEISETRITKSLLSVETQGSRFHFRILVRWTLSLLYQSLSACGRTFKFWQKLNQRYDGLKEEMPSSDQNCKHGKRWQNAFRIRTL